MKDKIVDRAAEMFLSLGFKSVTMDDLANEMGISKKTIYTHFPNKTKLVAECTLHVFHRISEAIEKICSMNKNPIEELYEIKKHMMVHLKNEKSSPQYQLQKYYPQIYDTLRNKQYEVMRECVLENLNKGIEMGIYRENLNLAFVSRIYFSGAMSIKNIEIFPQDIFPMTELMDNYLEYHLRGIVTPKGRTILNKIINSNQQ
ncbi:AcrR family transcriptional regulator [Saonia flava]|uniref:AcrR family transcriptional regulator n=1 Tax=Saonia flava TaxID=523696 RepID=A0A846QUI4_9FLAO|nr:TetR/AcrR family transcriptional regulator [Saonia flava]NJB71698.1 AcrR family transcriptional regulator [Saonia flava]